MKEGNTEENMVGRWSAGNKISTTMKLLQLVQSNRKLKRAKNMQKVRVQIQKR